jgi:hypothetical protein
MEADARIEAALDHMAPGWTLLRDCVLGPRQMVHYALLHPDIGIALVDLAPGRLPEAVASLRRRLDQVGFRMEFGGMPPIVYRSLQPNQIDRLPEVLSWAFGREEPLALRSRK